MLRVFFFFVFLGCTVASRGGYQMARGRHYAKLSLSNAARLSFSDLCILLFMFLSLCRLCVCVFLCSHWSLVDVPLIFFCPADHVPDWQPRVLLGMVEARSVNVKKTTNNNNSGENSNIIYVPFILSYTSKLGVPLVHHSVPVPSNRHHLLSHQDQFFSLRPSKWRLLVR